MKKRLLISLLTLLCCGTGMWALDRDTENYYILSSLQDWKDFASLAQTVPTINARMIADIDLGSDQTMIGSYATRYSGTFDGQGHTLTFNYNTSSMSVESGQSYLGAAPFRDIEGATIRNLHTAGSITVDKVGAAGLVGWAYGTNTIENCWSDVNLVSSNNTADTFTGFVAFMYGTNLTITDCVYTGLIQSTSKISHAGFIGYHTYGTATLTNCLLILDDGSDVNTTDNVALIFYTFDRLGSGYSPVANFSNCFYKEAFGISQGTQASSTNLSDGTTATALQNGRTETVWVQDGISGQPRLDVFNHPVTTYDPYVHPTSQIINLSELTEDYIAQDGDVLTGTTGYSIQIAADATITLSDVTITNYRKSPIQCLGNATINIEDGSVNRLRDLDEDSNSYGRPALAFGPSGTTLTINGNTGRLIAIGGRLSSAIGCRDNRVAYGGLIINGGVISAHGNSSYTSGIGAVGADDSHGSSCGDITINGGTINAAASDGIGIGAGGPNSCGAITINGGTITSHAVRSIAIGGNCSKVVINGGDINASTTTSVGIGSSGVVYIERGTIVASASGSEGVGISGDKGVLIRSSITSLTASKGPNAANAIQGATVYISANLNDVTEGNTRTLTPKASFDPEADIVQDGEGYYLIGSLQNWKEFAAIVNSGTNPAANAKMTADIDLGNDQTMVGTYATRYGGIFDGQGHTLTIHYNTSGMTIESGQSYLGAAPFRDIEGATIRNVNTAGNITVDKIGASGLVGWAYGTNTIENCWSDVNLVSSNGTADTFCGFVAFLYGTSINIKDCLFTGLIQSTSKQSHSGFIGYHNSGISVLTNCLVILDEGSDASRTTPCGFMYFTFDRFACGDQSGGTYTNCFYYRDFGVAQGTQATAAELANGAIAYRLQNGRADLVWGQRIGIDAEPVLTSDENYRVYKSVNGGYTNDVSEAKQEYDTDGYFLLGSLQDWQDFAALVNGGTTNVNARMTADIDLGDDQTVIGSPTVSTTAYSLGAGAHYKGIFDGQGHTLTVAYNATGSNSASPFSSIEGATIKNLHIDGTMVSSYYCGAGVASATGGNGNVIQNVWVSTTISETNGYSAGFVGCAKNGSISIIDCLFTGSVTSSQSHNGCFVGYIDSGSATVTNCLSTGNFTYGGCDWQGNHANCYVKQFPSEIPSTMQVSNAQLADGTTAAALQNNRAETIWVQEGGQPMLAVFSVGRLKANQDPENPGVYYTTFYHSTQKYLLPTGVEAYVATLSSNELVLTKIAEGGDVIPANNAVILKANAASVTLTPTMEDTVTFSATNNLQGVDAATTAPANCYVLSGRSTDNLMTGVAFYQFSGTLKAHRAYVTVTVSEPNNAPGRLQFVTGEATDITEVQNAESRVKKYIHNGQLIIEKDGVRYNVQGLMVK